jgi:hypothetical protein
MCLDQTETEVSIPYRPTQIHESVPLQAPYIHLIRELSSQYIEHGVGWLGFRPYSEAAQFVFVVAFSHGKLRDSAFKYATTTSFQILT